MNISHAQGIQLRTRLQVAAFLVASCCAYTSSSKDVVVKIAQLSERNGNALVRGLDFSPDGNSLAVDAEGPSINIWDWRRKQIVKTLQKPDGGNDFNVANPLSYSADGRFLVNCEGFSESDVVARIWNVAGWAVVKDIIGTAKPTDVGNCTSGTFSTDRKLLFLTSDTGVRVPRNSLMAFGTDDWQPQWGALNYRFFPNPSFFTPASVATSPNGEFVAVGGALSTTVNEGKIYILNIQQQSVIRTISTEAIGPLSWSPDGKRIAIAGAGFVKVVDVQSGEELANEKLDKSAHMNVRFTSDGRYSIESDMNGRGTGLGVRIWDGQRTALLQEIPGNISSIAVSRDSKFLAVGVTGHTTIWQFN